MKRRRFVEGTVGTAVIATIPGVALASADVTLQTPTGSLAGTLETPSLARPPLVLLIAGSGPTDRDGNNPLLPGKNDSLKLLAVALAQRGIASLRYDKRGVGASSAAARSESEMRFETYVDDAVAWLQELDGQRRFSRIVVAGHSEGSLIGMLAAQRTHTAAFVSLEGAGHPAEVVLLAQLRAARPDVRDAATSIVTALVRGRTVANVPAPLAAMFRPSVQPYLISWFRYDPAREIAKVAGPATIVQGTADVQTTRAEGDALHAAAPRARYVVVEGMNHVLKYAPDTASDGAIAAGYSDPALPVAAGAVEAVASAALGT